MSRLLVLTGEGNMIEQAELEVDHWAPRGEREQGMKAFEEHLRRESALTLHQV